MNTVKKDPVESAIISKINEHKNEITRLEGVLKVYNYSAGGTPVVELAPRMKRKYVRNEEPIKNPKTILVVNKKQNTSNLNNVNWSHRWSFYERAVVIRSKIIGATDWRKNYVVCS